MEAKNVFQRNRNGMWTQINEKYSKINWYEWAKEKHKKILEKDMQDFESTRKIFQIQSFLSAFEESRKFFSARIKPIVSWKSPIAKIINSINW